MHHASYRLDSDFLLFFVRRKILTDKRLMFHQLGLRSIWEKYYEEAHAVIYVIDASCPSRFEDSKSALGMFIGKKI